MDVHSTINMMIREVGGLDFDEVSPGMAEKADRIENGRVNEVVHLTGSEPTASDHLPPPTFFGQPRV